MRNLIAAVERIDPLSISGRVAAVNGLLVEARGGKVKVVEGDPKLIKVTDAGDLERVAALL